MHHMEVFQCSPDIHTLPDYSGSCDDKMKPNKLNSCRHVLAAWAMGAEVRSEKQAGGRSQTKPLASSLQTRRLMN